MNHLHLPGDPQARPPFIGKNVLLQGGFLKCDGGKLDALCDLTLNQVDPDLRFQAVGDHVLYAALFAERMSSAHPEDAEFGYVPEMDIGLWVLTWGGRRGHLPALRWTPAFIFVDSATALVTGRELYGYPKQLARIARMGTSEQDFRAYLRAVSFEKKDPNERGREHEVLSVGRGEASPQPFEDGVDSLSLLSGYKSALAAAPAMVDPLGLLTPPFIGMPMVFLRQMRDVTAQDDVIVQEIASVTVQPTHVAQAGAAPSHQITLKPLASVPIADCLGCASTVDLEWPFWARFDFSVGVGQRL